MPKAVSRYVVAIAPTRLNTSLLVALSIGLGYALVVSLWINFSTALVADVASSTQQLLLLELYKAAASVALMTVVLTALVYFLHRQGKQAERAYSTKWIDTTTGLMNRSAAKAFVRKSFSEALRHNKTFSVLHLDIRQLRRINQALGRSAGDEALRRVAERLKEASSSASAVARLESDSFLMTLSPGMTTDEAQAFAKNVLARFDTPLNIQGQEIKVDLYGGLAVAPEHGTAPFDLMDTAMRARDRCFPEARDLCVAGPQDRCGRKDLLALEAELRRAISKREFSLVFQPKVDLRSFEVLGAEALVRWHHPIRGIVPPAEFIPLAESLGLIPGITEQVLEKALEACAGWRSRGAERARVSVNLSPLDLKDERIVQKVADLLRQHRLPGRNLVLEITESWLMDDPDAALATLAALRKLGICIAIDDFGTGYSSLSQLIRFPVDRVKIDRSFVSGVDRDRRKRAILEAIRHIASSLGAKTVAEGAETFDELVVLKRIGFDQVQGYVISAPLPADVFEDDYLKAGVISELEATRYTLNKIIGEHATTRINP